MSYFLLFKQMYCIFIRGTWSCMLLTSVYLKKKKGCLFINRQFMRRWKKLYPQYGQMFSFLVCVLFSSLVYLCLVDMLICKASVCEVLLPFLFCCSLINLSSSHLVFMQHRLKYRPHCATMSFVFSANETFCGKQWHQLHSAVSSAWISLVLWQYTV